MAIREHHPMAEKQSVARQILEDARFEKDQAEAIITTVNLATENLATKDDVEELRNEMLKEFKLSDQRTDNKFEKMRNQLDANANSTNAKLDKMDAKFDKNDARFDQIESKFKNLTLRLIAAVVSTIVTLATLYTAVTKFFAG